MRTTGMKLLIVGVFLAVSSATNASVVLSHVEGIWVFPTGGDPSMINYYHDVSTSYGSGRQQQILWGDPVPSEGDQQSGLGFTGVAAPHRHVDIGVPFDVSEFTHFNNVVVPGTACEYVDLVLAMDFENGPLSQFQFSFAIAETLNEPGPPDSYDVIYFPDVDVTRSVTINGTNYTLQLLGFGQDSDEFQSYFYTPEKELDSTRLWAVLVPEPATVLLLGSGALVFLRRKS